MSFILHNSNKVENLVAQLSEVIVQAPLASIFTPEKFLIQSQGMERWLSQQLAQRLGVWANYEFLFPSKFFGDLAQTIGASLKNDRFDRHTMVWRIETLLRDLQGEQFTALSHYLSGSNTALKRYQLAQQLSQLFDQYQMMRPELLTQWQKGELRYHKETERWQKALWLAITQQLGQEHRGALWLKTIKQLNDAPTGEFSALLPERVFVFGVNTMPPLFLGYLQGLSKHCAVHLFLLNPSSDYWADIASKRQHALDNTRFIGHPLLSSLGQQGREFQDMLLELNIHFEDEFNSFEQNPQPNLLQWLQNDILNNNTDNALSDKVSIDTSISIHACHSRLREVEVLKQYILQALEQDNHLELRDIIVMAPDIQLYEPFIAAVFSEIQHAIADRSLRLSNQRLDAFIQFLKVCQSRFGWQTVLDLLEHPVVYPHFNLSEADLVLIKQWMQDTQVRWAKSGQHKGTLGLPEMNENTWQAMLERLLMGYAVGDDNQFVLGILPYKAIEGSVAQALGGLCAFIECLFRASEELNTAKTLIEWTTRLAAYAQELLDDSNSAEQQQLNELLAELSEGLATVHHDTIELYVVISWLQGKVEERKSANGFLRGQLTFCSLLPMRSIPFKVIALLGINDGEFPKVERKPTFDLLAYDFKKGDRSRRADDRYQFLEILLSARQQLIITYIGQSINHNEVIPPSVIVSELLDVLSQSYGLNNQHLITYQPLQAFSPHYFTGENNLISFSASDCDTARVLQQPRNTEIKPWWQGELMDNVETTLELAQLFSFFKQPQRYFMQRQLGTRFSYLTATAEEREPFTIASLDAYNIAQDWINTRLANKEVAVKILQARGHWLSGGIGELEFSRQKNLITQFVTRIQTKTLGEPLADLAFDTVLAPDNQGHRYRLIGLIGHRYQRGSLFYRYADLKGKDFICALLQHCLLNQLEPHNTYIISKDEDLVLLPEHYHPDYLALLCNIYQQGLLHPDAFFVEAAFAYCQQAYKISRGGRADKSPLTVALENLSRAIEQPYEVELQRLYAGINPASLLDARFEYYCQTLLQPIWTAVQC